MKFYALVCIAVFCTATCPTYQVLGDELDSPRGRIYLIKDMLENNRVPDEKTVKHIDRCLSCLRLYEPLARRGCIICIWLIMLVSILKKITTARCLTVLCARSLAQILPFEKRFRFAMRGAQLAKPFTGIMPAKIRNMVEFAPAKLPPPSLNDRPQVFAAMGQAYQARGVNGRAVRKKRWIRILMTPPFACCAVTDVKLWWQTGQGVAGH